jgi:hypothetical protein
MAGALGVGVAAAAVPTGCRRRVTPQKMAAVICGWQNRWTTLLILMFRCIIGDALAIQTATGDVCMVQVALTLERHSHGVAVAVPN